MNEPTTWDGVLIERLTTELKDTHNILVQMCKERDEARAELARVGDLYNAVLIERDDLRVAVDALQTILSVYQPPKPTARGGGVA